MIFKKRFSSIKICFVAIAFISIYSCQKSDDFKQGERDISHVSFINLLPDSIPDRNNPDVRLGVDFYLGDQIVNVHPFYYKQGMSRYIDFLSNKTEISMRRTGSALSDTTLNASKNIFYSVFLGRVTRRASLGDSIFNIVSQDDLAPTSVRENAKIRFAFLSQDMPTVAVNAKLIVGEVSRKDSVILTGGRFKSVSPFTEIRSQRVVFQFRSSGSGNRRVDTVELQAGKMYTYTVYGGWSAVDSTKSSLNVVETINR